MDGGRTQEETKAFYQTMETPIWRRAFKRQPVVQVIQLDSSSESGDGEVGRQESPDIESGMDCSDLKKKEHEKERVKGIDS